MPREMPLKPMTIRFAPDAINAVQEAADQLGISVAQFVREAAVMRAMVVETESAKKLEELSSEVRRLARKAE